MYTYLLLYCIYTWLFPHLYKINGMWNKWNEMKPQELTQRASVVYCAHYIFKNIAGTLWAACSRVLEKLIVTQIGRNVLIFMVPRESLPRLPEGCILSLVTSVCISHPKIQRNKGEKGEVRSFLTSVVDGGEWLSSCFGCWNPSQKSPF
jgi:hypothetical protein